ncbi:MAG: polymer-forming cytoskeletal protein [Spirochaetaceae bacterium]|jgi:cytoskeletal protein CcmA (bactofilin family)|nr:polymer-forming cytoskeletal protein [Spirochaetaceae bacterium]
MVIDNKNESSKIVTLSNSTSLKGVLKFKKTFCIRGKFTGTIEATEGSLIIDKGAVVEADSISVTNLTVYGKVTGPIHAEGKVDLYAGAEVYGNLVTARLRIADGVFFEGKCEMINAEKDIEIFSRPATEIKAELRRSAS